MTRRAQVGRREDTTTAAATPRDLGGCQIYCITSPCQDVTDDETILIGPITLTTAGTYQRIFVAATVAGVFAGVEDAPAPGEGTWTVTFTRDAAGNTGLYNPDLVGNVSLIGLEWSMPPYDPFDQNGIYKEDGLGFYSILFNLSDTGSETAEPGATMINDRVRMRASEGSWSVTMTLFSPNGEFQTNETIT